MHGIVRMWPLPLQTHLFFICLSHLLNGGSGSSRGSLADDTAKDFQDLHLAEPKRILSWTEIYVPVRRCHAIFKDKMGEFSIPVIRNRHFKNIWCNWTIWAGPRNHIIIYVQGFRGRKDCEENPDKIVFQGVASVVESTIAYACWNKRVHVYATQALAVNVALLLKNYVQNNRYRHFRGKYYIFRNPREKTSQREDSTFQVPFQRPSKEFPYSSTGPKVELPVVMSVGAIEMTSPKLMPSKALQPERSYTWETEKVEFSETSLPYSERPSDKSHVNGITITKTLGIGEMNLGDELFSKALGETVALNTRWLEIIEETSILSPGSTMNGSAAVVKILYENTPYFVGPEQSTIMEDWYTNIKSGSSDNQTDYLIPTSENAPINIKPTPISHSISLSDSGFLEKTGHSKNEKTHFSPSKIWSSLPGNEQQPFLQSEVLTQETVTLSTDSMGNYISGTSLASETQLILKSSLHLIPVVPTFHMAVGFSPQSFKGGDLLTDSHSGVVISLETLQTLGGGMIWLNSPEIFGETGLTLTVASPDGLGLVPELPSTISIKSTRVRAEAEPEVLLQTARALVGSAETESLTSSVASEEIPSRHQMSLAKTNIKFIIGQESSLPFTIHQESLFDAELTPTFPRVAMSEIVPEWILQDIPVPSPSAYHNEQVTTEQSLGIPLTLTPAAILKVKWPSMTPVETRAKLDSTSFASVHHEESIVATMFSLEIALSYYSDFSKSNVEHDFSSPAVVSLAFLPTPTLSINDDQLALSSQSSYSWDDLGEMFTSVRKTEPLDFFTSRNVDFATSVSCPKCLELDSKNLFDLLEGKSFSDKKTQSVSQLVPKSELSQGRDTSSGSEIPLVTKTSYEITPLSALNWTPTKTTSLSWEHDEIQTEMTIQPSKKDAMVNESNPWKSSNSLKKDEKPIKFNITSLLPSVPTMSLGKQDQTRDLSTVSSSLFLWSNDTNLLEAKKSQDSSEILTSTNMAACVLMRRCHVFLKDTFGIFSLPENLNSSWSNICCNWTIWTGSKKHIVVYIKGFEGPENCDQNQDKIIFQGVSSSVERKTFYACRRPGTLVFATQALAVHIVFLSVRSYPRYIPGFKGQYFVFTDPERQVPPKPAIASLLATFRRLRERTLSKVGSHPELMTKPQPGSFPNLKTIYMGVENKSQTVTEVLMPKNRELTEGEGKGLEWKHLHSLLSLIPPTGPLVGNQKSAPISLKQEPSRPTEMIKSSAVSGSVAAFSVTLTPVTSDGYKASQDGWHVDSWIVLSHWPSKTLPLTKLPPEPVDIPDKLLPSASIREQRMPWITDKTEKLVWQGDLVITKPSNLYAPLTVESIRKPQDAGHNHDHLNQSFSHVMLVKGKNFLITRPGVDESVTGPSNIPKEEQSSNLLFNDVQVAPEPSATGKGRARETSLTKEEVSREVGLDLAQSSTLENIRYPNEELLDLRSSREGTISKIFEWDSVSPGSLTEHSPSLKTPHTALSFLGEVIDNIHPNPGAIHSSAPVPNIKAKAMAPLTPGQMWKNVTADGVLVLTPGYSDARTTSPSLGSESVLEFQHYPGDLLYEVIVEMECQVETSYNASEVEKVLVDSLKQEIGANLGHFSPEADVFQLIKLKRRDISNVTFMFWLHLGSRERNMSDALMSQLGAFKSNVLHSQLRPLIRDTVEALQLHLKYTSIHDVNECELGLEQCGDGAECSNAVGTYVCHCKEDYEDHSPMQNGTLCIHVPRSGVGFSFSYLDLLIVVAVFASVFMLLTGFVWLATRTTQEKRDFCLQETTSLGVSTLPRTQTKACLNLTKFSKYPISNAYQPKPPDRVIDDSLGQTPT